MEEEGGETSSELDSMYKLYGSHIIIRDIQRYCIFANYVDDEQILKQRQFENYYVSRLSMTNDEHSCIKANLEGLRTTSQ